MTVVADEAHLGIQLSAANWGTRNPREWGARNLGEWELYPKAQVLNW
jgi:hypothetical protein